jgi:hypothetical protein
MRTASASVTCLYIRIRKSGTETGLFIACISDVAGCAVDHIALLVVGGHGIAQKAKDLRQGIADRADLLAVLA